MGKQFSKMSPIEAIEWFEDSGLNAWEIRVLSERGIDDTDRITKVLKSDLDIEELVAVPDLEPTDANLALLATAGSEIMLNDRENAIEWAKLVTDFDLEADVAIFRQAGRSPSFARKVLELFTQEDSYGASDIGSYDMTRPYAEIADRRTGGLTSREMEIWEALGVDLSAALQYQADGLSAREAEALVKNWDVDRRDWMRYKDLPQAWLGKVRDTFTDRKMPEGWATLDELLDLYQRGYTEGTPWSAQLPDQKYYAFMRVSLTQARMLADAGMKAEMIARMWAAGTTSGRRTVENSPPRMLPYLTNNSDSLSDATMADMIAVYKAGVRASHLSDYRWGGCHTLQEILMAVADGINPARVKELRKRYGKQKYTSTPQRISDFKALVAYHNIEQNAETARQTLAQGNN